MNTRSMKNPAFAGKGSDSVNTDSSLRPVQIDIASKSVHADIAIYPITAGISSDLDLVRLTSNSVSAENVLSPIKTRSKTNNDSNKVSVQAESLVQNPESTLNHTASSVKIKLNANNCANADCLATNKPSVSNTNGRRNGKIPTASRNTSRNNTIQVFVDAETEVAPQTSFKNVSIDTRTETKAKNKAPLSAEAVLPLQNSVQLRSFNSEPVKARKHELKQSLVDNLVCEGDNEAKLQPSSYSVHAEDSLKPYRSLRTKSVDIIKMSNENPINKESSSVSFKNMVGQLQAKFIINPIKLDKDLSNGDEDKKSPKDEKKIKVSVKPQHLQTAINGERLTNALRDLRALGYEKEHINFHNDTFCKKVLHQMKIKKPVNDKRKALFLQLWQNIEFQNQVFNENETKFELDQAPTVLNKTSCLVQEVLKTENIVKPNEIISHHVNNCLVTNAQNPSSSESKKNCIKSNDLLEHNVYIPDKLESKIDQTVYEKEINILTPPKNSMFIHKSTVTFTDENTGFTAQKEFFPGSLEYNAIKILFGSMRLENSYQLFKHKAAKYHSRIKDIESNNKFVKETSHHLGELSKRDSDISYTQQQHRIAESNKYYSKNKSFDDTVFENKDSCIQIEYQLPSSDTLVSSKDLKPIKAHEHNPIENCDSPKLIAVQKPEIINTILNTTSSSVASDPGEYIPPKRELKSNLETKSFDQNVFNVKQSCVQIHFEPLFEEKSLSPKGSKGKAHEINLIKQNDRPKRFKAQKSEIISKIFNTSSSSVASDSDEYIPPKLELRSKRHVVPTDSSSSESDSDALPMPPQKAQKMPVGRKKQDLIRPVKRNVNLNPNLSSQSSSFDVDSLKKSFKIPTDLDLVLQSDFWGIENFNEKSTKNHGIIKKHVYSKLAQQGVTCELTFKKLRRTVNYIRLSEGRCNYSNVHEIKCIAIISELALQKQNLFIFSNGDIFSIDHAKDTKSVIFRQIRGAERIQVASEIKNVLPHNHKTEQIAKFDMKFATKGNTDAPNPQHVGLMNDAVRRKIKSETNTKNRSSDCLLTDASIKWYHQDKKYIRHINYCPDRPKDGKKPRDEFCLLLIHHDVAEEVSKLASKPFEACLDATGSVVQRLKCCKGKHASHSQIMIYLFVVKIGDTIVNLMEFITTMHNVDTIVDLLKRGKEIYEKEYLLKLKNPNFSSLVKLVKTDMSSVLMNATCVALNGVSLTAYLNAIYTGKQHNYTWLLLCCAHLIHMVSTNAKKVLDKVKQKQLISFIVEVFCLLINANDPKQIREIIYYSLFIVKCQYQCKELDDMKRKLGSLTERVDISQTRTEVSDFENSQPDILYNLNDLEISNTGTKREQIVFYNHYRGYATRSKEAVSKIKAYDSSWLNPLHDAQNILEKSLDNTMAFVAMFSRGYYHEITDTRASTADVEIKNKILKGIILNNQNPVPLNVYLDKTFDHCTVQGKELAFPIIADCMKGKKAKKLSKVLSSNDKKTSSVEETYNIPAFSYDVFDDTQEEIWSSGKKSKQGPPKINKKSGHMSVTNLKSSIKVVDDPSKSAFINNKAVDLNIYEGTLEQCLLPQDGLPEDNLFTDDDRLNILCKIQKLNISSKGIVLDEAYHHISDIFYAKYVSHWVMYSDFMSLNTNEWLSDAIIDALMGIIKTKFEHESSSNEQIQCVSSNHVRLLFLNAVKSMDGLVRNSFAADKRYFIMPLLTNQHWTVSIADTQTKNFYHFDSAQSMEKAKERRKTLFSKFLIVKNLLRKEWTYSDEKGVGQQNDGSSCGIFVFKNAHCFFLEDEYDHEINVLDTRKELKQLILNNSENMLQLCQKCIRKCENDHVECTCCSRKMHQHCFLNSQNSIKLDNSDGKTIVCFKCAAYFKAQNK